MTLLNKKIIYTFLQNLTKPVHYMPHKHSSPNDYNEMSNLLMLHPMGGLPLLRQGEQLSLT